MKAARFKFQIVLILVLCALQNPVSGQAPFWEWAISVNGLSQLHCNKVQAIDGGCFTTANYANSLILPNDTLTGSSYMTFTNSSGELRMGIAMTEPQQLFDIGNGRIGFASTINSSFRIGAEDYPSLQGIGLITGSLDTTGIVSDVHHMPNLIVGNGNGRVIDVHQGANGNLFVLGTMEDSVAISDTVLYGSGSYFARFAETGELIRADTFDITPLGFANGSNDFGCIVEGVDGTVYLAVVQDNFQNQSTLGEGLLLIALGPDNNILRVWANGNWSFYEDGEPYIAAHPDGGTYLAHQQYSPSIGSNFINVMRFSSTGEVLWENTIATPTTGSFNARPSKIETTDLGVLISGFSNYRLTIPGLEYMTYGPNCIVYELSEENELLWAISETGGNIFGAQASKNSAGEVYAAGWRELQSQFGPHELPVGPNSTSGYIARIGYGWLGIEEHLSSAFGVHPNPAASTVHFSQHFEPGTELRIFDASGRRVMSRVLGSRTSAVDISDLVPGIYLLRIGDRQVRIVKQ